MTPNTFTYCFTKSIIVMNIYNLAFLLLFQFSFLQSCHLPDSQQEQKRDKATAANLIFKSTDGELTWQDISKGLPENLEEGGFFANESGPYLRAGNEIYHSKPNSTAPFWKKDIFIFSGKQGSITPAEAGIVAYNFDGQFLRQIKGTSAWLPVHTNFQGKEVRTVFETAGDTVFTGGLEMKIVESNGVLLATGSQGILRSTDDGETWKWVVKEGVGIALERIKGGLAAITYNVQSRTRRVRTSYDGGNSWQPIDTRLQAQVVIDSIWRPGNDGLPVQAFITSIVQVGKYFFCGHPAGIFRSSDKGKTWKLVLPLIYGIPTNRGC